MAHTGVVYHWKHGWIPLDHTAAVKKAKGDQSAAIRLLASARQARGIRTSSELAHAKADVANLPASHQASARRQIVEAEDTAGGSHAAEGGIPLPGSLVRDLRGGSAERHLVAGPNGTQFSPDRAALHDQIIAKVLGKHATQSRPAFVMLGGGPASGKSKAAEAAANEFPDAVKIDPDEIKKLLPEYEQLVRRDPNNAAHFVHEESSYLAKRALDEAFKRRHHVVLDAVGDNSIDSVRGKIEKARGAGYSAHGRYVTVPTGVALTRAESRGAKSGRIVPEDVITGAHAGVSRVFPEVMHDFDTAALYDNTTQWKQVLSKHRGQPEIIHDLQAWRSFLQKANG